EMKRQGFKLPLLIGGATTSKTHTALKIEPQYDGVVMHVLDASRSVGVVSQLLSKEGETAKIFAEEVKKDYEELRIKRNASETLKDYISIEEARNNKNKIDWNKFSPLVPKKLGVEVFDEIEIERLIPYIDWTPFFSSWQLKGKYPTIFKDAYVGKEAKELYDHAQEMLTLIVSEKRLKAKAVIGIFEA